MASLSVGMATYKDFDGVWFTTQAMRLDPAAKGVQFIVVDNFGCQRTENFCKSWGAAKYVVEKKVVGTAYPRDMIFQHAECQFVLVLDCHVLLAPGALGRLRQFIDHYSDTNDLLQGPMYYDDLKTFATHMKPTWSAGMWGQWAADKKGADPDGAPFEIPMHGLGLFCCRRAAWPGFNPEFRGFGGEEGYIHAKFKNRGDRTLCLPWLRWVHRFQDGKTPQPYPNTYEDRIRNYLIGHAEAGIPLDPLISHFATAGVSPEIIGRIARSCGVSVK